MWSASWFCASLDELLPFPEICVNAFLFKELKNLVRKKELINCFLNIACNRSFYFRWHTINKVDYRISLFRWLYIITIQSRMPVYSELYLSNLDLAAFNINTFLILWVHFYFAFLRFIQMITSEQTFISV